MKFNIESLEKSLNSSHNKLKEEEKKLKNLIIESDNIDNTNILQDTLYDILSDKELNYHKANKAYKEYISKYSKEYIELSEHYYGPELPYDIYCKEFIVCDETDHYLKTPKDIKELYSLFMFYGMLEFALSEYIK